MYDPSSRPHRPLKLESMEDHELDTQNGNPLQSDNGNSSTDRLDSLLEFSLCSQTSSRSRFSLRELFLLGREVGEPGYLL